MVRDAQLTGQLFQLASHRPVSDHQELCGRQLVDDQPCRVQQRGVVLLGPQRGKNPHHSVERPDPELRDRRPISTRIECCGIHPVVDYSDLARRDV
ncbi:hypothetical protein [Rhodococcus koreensis]|uniref:hypothetical protein n=1 Tax=Rhodococcus koreensis TaxID=99653 RepID=UPI001FC8FF89|nr:hypothetical protein [Rhodococcus koreensis]